VLIELVNVGFTYMPGTPFAREALKSISLRISDGEFIGLVGPTGSGKSTLIQHLNGLLAPAEGRVLFRGKEIGKELSFYRVREEVGMVFQFPENQLFEETVENDIAFGPKNLGLTGEDISSRVKEALGQVGLDYHRFSDRSPHSLSGGEMRLVAIAGVLAMRPKVLILDEPTSGLDAHGKKEIFECLDRLNKSGVTIIMVTHSMDEVAEAARRIIVLNEGRVLLDDNPERVFSSSELLVDIGLNVPKTVELLAKLRLQGLNVDTGAINLRSTVNTIHKAIKEMTDV